MSATLEALEARVAAVARDPGVRALVLTRRGARVRRGRGHRGDASVQRGRGGRVRATHLGDVRCGGALPCPTIAAVNGVAFGGGMGSAGLRIYAPGRAHRIGLTETSVGIMPGAGGTRRLVRLVGRARAKELVFTARRLDAEQALRIGLANRLFAPEALLPAALAAAEKIAEKGPLAVAAAKRVIQQGQDADARVAHALEQEAFAAAFATEDRAEGMAAFLEKRAPVFKGR